MAKCPPEDHTTVTATSTVNLRGKRMGWPPRDAITMSTPTGCSWAFSAPTALYRAPETTANISHSLNEPYQLHINTGLEENDSGI